MAASRVLLLLVCWLLLARLSRSNFYYDCENMNCSCVVRMQNILEGLDRRLDSVVPALTSDVRNSSERAEEGVKFDGLRSRIVSVGKATDSVRSKADKLNDSGFSELAQIVKGQRSRRSDVEESIGEVTKFLEVDVHRKRGEVAALVTQSREKERGLIRGLSQIRNQLDRLKLNDSIRGMAELKNLYKIDRLKKDWVRRSEYNKDASELLNLNQDVVTQLDSLNEAERLLDLAPKISFDDTSDRLNFLKASETDLNNALEAIGRQRNVLLNEIKELTVKIEENERLISQLNKRIGGKKMKISNRGRYRKTR